MNHIKTLIFPLFVLLAMISCKPTAVKEVVFLNHRLEMELNVKNQSASFIDEGLMRVNSGLNLFYLTPDASVDALVIDGAELDFKTLDSVGLSSLKSSLASKILMLDPPVDALWVLFSQKTAKKAEFQIKYTSEFKADVSGVSFSNQNVGREVGATILEKGAYFSPSSYYYPQGNDELMDFEIKATIPANWESIADGNSLGTETSDSKKIQAWKNPYQSDGLMFMAAPFVVAHTTANDIDIYCYFFEEDTSLFKTYLPATARYVEMYSEMIGPYPYKRFTVAENFFPTGYGMPAWTLLGQRVIRLPFIVLTSLGHEVLHNWWGNSIYVNYEKGNWCEGLTVYGADYYYKLQRSPASARDYRKDILKQYKSYVTVDNEFPVRDFVARHNAESRTIGYNKTMLIFHMLEKRIGTTAFFQAWRDIYANHKGEQVTWETWIAAYEKSSGQNLSFIIPQWVDRTGAANISVELLGAEQSGNQTALSFRIIQPDQRYNLLIPIRFSGSEPSETTVAIKDSVTTINLTIAGVVTAFELDPDYDLFRQLYPEEIEPTIAAVLGTAEKHFEFFSAKEKVALKTFGDNLTEGDVEPEAGPITSKQGVPTARISLNPKSLPEDLLEQIKPGNTSVIIKGTEYPRAGHTFILSAAENQELKNMVILTDDLESLPRIGQLVPHYGKYSYLVFRGSRNIAKGQWPSLASPLRVELTGR